MNFSVVDGNGDVSQLFAVGEGTEQSPLIFARASIEQATANIGRLFVYSERLTLNNNAELSIQVITPSNKAAQLFAIEIFAIQAPLEFSITEAALVSANGSQKILFNFNRQSSISAITSVYLAPTVTSIGSPIYNGYVSGGRDTGGILCLSSPFILKQNERYLIIVKNISGGLASFSTRLVLIEE